MLTLSEERRRYILVRAASEIGLKGGSRSYFERKLVENVRRATKKFRAPTIERLSGGLIVSTFSDANYEAIKNALAQVFGISSYAPCHITETRLDSIEKTVLELAGVLSGRFETFRVSTKRVDKNFPLGSMEMDRHLGKLIGENLHKKVDLENPGLDIHVAITRQGTFVYGEKFRGLGGLPVGSTGRVLALLSGGIDSPVSAWMMMKRGCSVDFLHVYPHRDPEEVLGTKVVDIVRLLAAYSPRSRLFLVPFEPFYRKTFRMEHRFELILFRRFLHKVAESVGAQTWAKALVTGDSLGQAASQTLENIYSAEQEVSIPIFRPLIGYDKEEIVSVAKSIGTYSHSISTHKDCCSILSRHPATKVHPFKLSQMESDAEISQSVDEAVSKTVSFRITTDSEERLEFKPATISLSERN